MQARKYPHSGTTLPLLRPNHASPFRLHRSRPSPYLDPCIIACYNTRMDKLYTIPSDLARLIAAQRKPKVRVCLRCGKEFTTIGRGLYCRLACKRAMQRKRAKEREGGDES